MRLHNSLQCVGITIVHVCVHCSCSIWLMFLLCYCAPVPTSMQLVTPEERETIARLRNCILALAKHKIMLYDTTIQYTFDASLRHKVTEKLGISGHVLLSRLWCWSLPSVLVQVKELMTPEIAEEITQAARQISLDWNENVGYMYVFWPLSSVVALCIYTYEL